VTARSCLG